MKKFYEYLFIFIFIFIPKLFYVIIDILQWILIILTGENKFQLILIESTALTIKETNGNQELTRMYLQKRVLINKIFFFLSKINLTFKYYLINLYIVRDLLSVVTQKIGCRTTRRYFFEEFKLRRLQWSLGLYIGRFYLEWLKLMQNISGRTIYEVAL